VLAALCRKGIRRAGASAATAVQRRLVGVVPFHMVERRHDPTDGTGPWTREEFIEHYGRDDGELVWNLAGEIDAQVTYEEKAAHLQLQEIKRHSSGNTKNLPSGDTKTSEDAVAAFAAAKAETCFKREATGSSNVTYATSTASTSTPSGHEPPVGTQQWLQWRRTRRQHVAAKAPKGASSSPIVAVTKDEILSQHHELEHQGNSGPAISQFAIPRRGNKSATCKVQRPEGFDDYRKYYSHHFATRRADMASPANEEPLDDSDSLDVPELQMDVSEAWCDKLSTRGCGVSCGSTNPCLSWSSSSETAVALSR